MEFITNVIVAIVSLPSVVVITLVMFLLCLIFGGGFKKAIRAGVSFGIGITGITLLMENVTTSLSSIAEALSTRFGLSLEIIDYGYGAAAFAFLAPQAVVALTAIIVIDIVFILLGWTKTLWVDIHNSWHGMFWGSMAYFITNNFVFALVVNVVIYIITLKLADITAPVYQEEDGIPGVAFLAQMHTSLGLFAKACMLVINKIPGLKDLEASPDDIQDKLGVFGEQSVMGMIIGIFLGILAGFDFGTVMQTGITIAATLAIFPKVAAFACEGIVPVTTTIMAFMKKRFEGKKDLYVAVDGAILLGNPAVMSVYVLIIPIVIILYMVIPGIRFIPIASIAAIPYIIGAIAPYCKSNVVHTLIVSTIALVILGFCATYVADAVTTSMKAIGMVDGSYLVTAIDEAGNPLGSVVKFLAQFFAK